ncbi:hypothetical protein ACKWTF_014618 [Chironomus riparius]
MIFSNSSILTKGRDECGNVCGELNDGNLNDQCGPHDMLNYPKLLNQRHVNKSWIIEYKCVTDCPQNIPDNIIQCWEKGDFLKVPNFLTDYGMKVNAFLRYMMTSWIGLGIYCAFSYLFSIIILILLRFIPQATIWAIPILLTGLLFLLAVLSFAFSFDSPSDGIESYLYIYVGFFVIMMFVFVKKIILAGKIFGQMTKSMIKISWILILPILTFLTLTILIAAFLFTSLWIETSGTFSPGSSEDGKFELKFEGTKIMEVIRILNILTFAWLGNFIINCQHFIIAGSVTKWYFTRDKNGLCGINKSSVTNLVRFHLGSVCFGSIAVPVVRFVHFGFRIVKCIKASVNYCFKGMQPQRCIQEFDSIDKIFGTFTKSAYVLIESHGTQFCESGKKSYDLFLENLGDIYWLNLFKDILLLLNQMFVPFVGIFAGLFIVDSKASQFTAISPASVDLIFTFLIAHCFFMAYGMTIDTIFLCCCIDFKENSLESKSYFMRQEMRKILMKIRKHHGLEVSLSQDEVTSNMMPMLDR